MPFKLRELEITAAIVLTLVSVKWSRDRLSPIVRLAAGTYGRLSSLCLAGVDELRICTLWSPSAAFMDYHV